MKSLWIVNKCCGALHQKLYGKKSTGGLWLDAMLSSLTDEDRVVVVNVEASPKLYTYSEGNVTFYTLKGEPNQKYDYKDPGAIAEWKKIIDTEKPDVIEIWGTEFPYALAALRAADNKIPSVIFVQGILDSIAKYYLSGLTEKELKGAVTLRDRLEKTTIRQTQRAFKKRAEYEKEIARLSGHIIVENEWAEAYYKKMLPEVKAHFLPISISESFASKSWEENSMASHTIMCSAADYPIKGLHMLLRALVIVKKTYPDVKLFVPGTPLRSTNTLKLKLKQHGYDKLISKMLAELELNENVSYTGRLTADEMAQKMSEVNCFVMCSAIENHSSTLKEAMTVGAPCIASYVGGVPEYAVNGENCLLYRFEDYEVLAQNICKLFEDKDLRAKLSKAAREQMRKPKEKNDYQQMREILKEVSKGI